MHSVLCGVEVTETSTNKQHHLSCHNDEQDRLAPARLGREQFGGGKIMFVPTLVSPSLLGVSVYTSTDVKEFKVGMAGSGFVRVRVCLSLIDLSPPLRPFSPWHSVLARLLLLCDLFSSDVNTQRYLRKTFPSCDEKDASGFAQAGDSL
jgi:hypothetical protein